MIYEFWVDKEVTLDELHVAMAHALVTSPETLTVTTDIAQLTTTPEFVVESIVHPGREGDHRWQISLYASGDGTLRIPLHAVASRLAERIQSNAMFWCRMQR
jgi:hypothetical protein